MAEVVGSYYLSWFSLHSIILVTHRAIMSRYIVNDR